MKLILYIAPQFLFVAGLCVYFMLPISLYNLLIAHAKYIY